MQELKECFSTRSIPKLQEVLSRMPKEESAYHMKRCIDSGLWVPDAKAAGEVQSSHWMLPTMVSWCKQFVWQVWFWELVEWNSCVPHDKQFMAITLSPLTW